ncbi:MAG: tetratricopeptide repeat protein, partial [Thermomicrobiaceae bacterium]|nr:tetratricopeptide repeat protein [Thermomicrobiaceae bacterium]
MSTFLRDGRNRSVRHQIERARRLAVAREWDEAVEVNRQILEQSPRDVEALNRLGKALMELGRFAEALEEYRRALEIDPTNSIAQRNASRLEEIIGTVGEAARPEEVAEGAPEVRSSVFIQETGKTYVTDLERPGEPAVLAKLGPGDEVDLRIQDQQVEVYTLAGERLGELEPRIAQRLIHLVSLGNRYRAYVVQLSGYTVRIILREVYRNPEAPEPISFPRQAKIAAPRPYLRETSRLGRELEPEMLIDEEEEEEEELEEELEEAGTAEEEEEGEEPEE